MANFVFNIAKGAAAEMVRDAPTSLGVMLLKTAEAEATLKDRADLAAILANGSVECDFTSYTRKTSITGTINVDTTNDRVDLDMPDQTWTGAGGAANNSVLCAIVFSQNTAADSGRVPLTCHDFVVTTDGSDLTMQINAAGFYRAA